MCWAHQPHPTILGRKATKSWWDIPGCRHPAVVSIHSCSNISTYSPEEHTCVYQSFREHWSTKEMFLCNLWIWRVKNISDGNREVDRKLEMPLRQKTIYSPTPRKQLFQTFPPKNLKSSNCVVCSVPHFFVGFPPSSTKVSWFGWSRWWNQWYFRWSHLDGCLCGENPSRSLCALDVCGWNRVNQGNYATKTTWRVEDKDRSNSGGLGNVVPGLVLSDSLTCRKLLSGIDTLDLLNATIPPVFIAWFDISKETWIFTLEEGLTQHIMLWGHNLL